MPELCGHHENDPEADRKEHEDSPPNPKAREATRKPHESAEEQEETRSQSKESRHRMEPDRETCIVDSVKQQPGTQDEDADEGQDGTDHRSHNRSKPCMHSHRVVGVGRLSAHFRVYG